MLFECSDILSLLQLMIGLVLESTIASILYKIQWITYLLQELKLPFIAPTLLYYDNQFAQYVVVNLTFHEQTKHIEINCHTLLSKFLDLSPVCTIDQLDDILIKSLYSILFHRTLNKVRVILIHSSACEGIGAKR
ncbi:hypothetical protein CR513_53522, partial [Mucuna pruriens]